MGADPKILHVFLSDALRLTSQALECVSQLSEQAGTHRVSPAQVRSLYQTVHTLKGTASMVEGCSQIVAELEGIEGKLACQSPLDSANHPEWIDMAEKSLKSTQKILKQLQNQQKIRHLQSSPSSRGLMVKTVLGNHPQTLWFPLSCLTQVHLMDEMSASEGAFRCKGAWLPILGKGKLGLGVRASAGEAVLMVEEAVAILSWIQAQEQGAQAGLEFLSPKAA